jgi:sulfite reductase (ferredoxin)
MTAIEHTQESWQHIINEVDMSKYLELYETELKRWLNGEVPEAIFTEFRLRHGVYGQRQPNQQMIRIKLPLGMVSTEQLKTMADLSDELADGVSHVTTRQDIQYHNVNIRDTPELLRRLAQVGITTLEACGNVVRNVCACTKSGVCASAVFDTTPDALAMSEFLLKHPEAQDFGRKFKISYSGCADEMCGLAHMHDIGAIAQVRQIEGKTVAGFELLIGGGLGAVPRKARQLYEFIPREELFSVAQAIARIFTRHGERRNRNRARFKFVVDKLGIDPVREMIEEERSKIGRKKVGASIFSKYSSYSESPYKPPSSLDLEAQSDEFKKWFQHNVEAQQQEGYSIAHIFCPLGDVTGDQLRRLVEISQQYIKDTIRLSAEQNIVFRWVSNAELPFLYEDLKQLGLHGYGNTLSDVTACPGTDSCKLGITASRGLAAMLHEQFQNELYELGEKTGMKIKVSGCPNSCGQHHIADLGFFGSAQSKEGRIAPVFQMLLGGTTSGNAQSYGLAVGKISPHRVPEAIERVNRFYENFGEVDESFSQFVERVGKKKVKEELADLMTLPTYEDNPDFFTDVGEETAFKLSTEKGECAGVLLPRTEFLLEECDRNNAQAAIMLEESRSREAYHLAKSSMEKASIALLLTQGYEEFGDYVTADAFKSHFVETSIFFAKPAAYYLKTLDEDFASLDETNIRYTIEQAILFVEEAHVVYSRIAQSANDVAA